jgi:hypothetical protein
VPRAVFGPGAAPGGGGGCTSSPPCRPFTSLQHRAAGAADAADTGRHGRWLPWPGRLGAPSAGLQLRVGARGPGSSSAAIGRRQAAGEASPHGRRRFPSPSSRI